MSARNTLHSPHRAKGEPDAGECQASGRAEHGGNRRGPCLPEGQLDEVEGNESYHQTREGTEADMLSTIRSIVVRIFLLIYKSYSYLWDKLLDVTGTRDLGHT